MLRDRGKRGEKTGTKILLEAMSKDKVHLAKFVLDALDGEIVDSQTEGAQTPLISSVLLPERETRCKFVELLLQRGAKVNCQDRNGRTALSHACEKGYLEPVKVLVQNNADPEIVDTWGNTPLMYAAVAGHSKVVEFLVKAFKRLGLQIHRQNTVGNSAVEVAKLLGHTHCISALTSNSRKSCEAEGGAHGNAQPRLTRGGGEESERKVGHSGNKLGLPQTDSYSSHDGSWQTRPGMKQCRLPSIDSIEEFERENENSCSAPHEPLFSGVLTPKPPPCTSDHSPVATHRAREKFFVSDDLFPPPVKSRDSNKSMFYSPQPKGSGPTPYSPSALCILLTPILTNSSETGPGTDKQKLSDFGLRTFNDSYYRKRSSLPTSLLSPTPPDRALVPARKSRTAKRREASPSKAEPALCIPSTSTTTTLSVLSNKLLRRFTSPEFKKEGKELGPVLTSGGMTRSETFPLSCKHPHVGSKPSVDSISSVKCEFDFRLRVPNN